MLFFNKNMLAGLAGALALNLVHQVMKHLDPEAPEIDKIGEDAVTQLVSAAGGTPPSGNKLFATALGGDLVSNAAYYSLIGMGSHKQLLTRGLLFGAAAGAGTLTLTRPLGLDDAPVKKTTKTKLLTLGYYILGGVVTALTVKALQKQERR